MIFLFKILVCYFNYSFVIDRSKPGISLYYTTLLGRCPYYFSEFKKSEAL